MDKVDMLKKYEEDCSKLDKELQELKRRIRQCRNMEEVQMLQIPFVNGDSGMYMVGLYNGMELMLAIIDDRIPQFAGIPMKAEEGDISGDMEEGEQIVDRTIAGLVNKEIGPCMGI